MAGPKNPQYARSGRIAYMHAPPSDAAIRFPFIVCGGAASGPLPSVTLRVTAPPPRFAGEGALRERRFRYRRTRTAFDRRLPPRGTQFPTDLEGPRSAGDP